MYTYFDGCFRGIYYRTKYIPLNWGMEINEVVEMEINMAEGVLRIGLRRQKQVSEIDISEMKQLPLYFFLEMYEKDNSLEFIA